MASIPEAPPLTKGLTVGHTPAGFAFFSSPIAEKEKGSDENEGERRRIAAEAEGERVVSS